MASTNHTTNYNLPQWERTDPFQMEDFNDAFEKIDTQMKVASDAAAEGPKIITGTYVGTGTFGNSNQSSLTFDKKPLAVFIGGGYYVGILVRGSAGGISYAETNDHGQLYTTWSDHSVQWYTSMNNNRQLNHNGTTYYYLAVVE